MEFVFSGSVVEDWEGKHTTYQHAIYDVNVYRHTVLLTELVCWSFALDLRFTTCVFAC